MICKKTKPSSQAQQTIQGCEYHDSHADHRFVWEYQSVWMMHSAFSAFPYAFRRYQKSSSISKIALATEMVQTLRLSIDRVYVLIDSWHSSKTLIEACLTQDFLSSLRSRWIESSIQKASLSKSKNLSSISKNPTSTLWPWEEKRIAYISMKGHWKT